MKRFDGGVVWDMFFFELPLEIQDDDAKFKSMERNAINSQKGPEKLRDAKQRTTSFAAAGHMN